MKHRGILGGCDVVRRRLQRTWIAQVVPPWGRLANDRHVVKRHEVAKVVFKIASVSFVFHLPRDVGGRLDLLHDSLLIITADPTHSSERIREVPWSCSLAICRPRSPTPSWWNERWRIATLELDAQLVDAATVQPRNLR